MYLQSRGLVSNFGHQGRCRIHVQRQYTAAAYELERLVVCGKSNFGIREARGDTEIHRIMSYHVFDTFIKGRWPLY